MKKKEKEIINAEDFQESKWSRDVKDISAMFENYKSAKSSTMVLWRQIKSFYDGTFWEEFKKKVKDHTLTPDTNYIEYVVMAYVNSIYSATYIPEVIATDLKDEDNASHLNAFLEMEFLRKCIKAEFIGWGENVCLYNMQPIKIFLDKNKNKVDFESINPFGIFLDPSVSDFKEGEAIFISKEVSIYTLLKDKRFKTEVKKYIEEHKDKLFEAKEMYNQEPNSDRFQVTGNKTVSLVQYYIKEDERVDEGYMINNERIIFEKKGIIPNEFPIEILYQRKPGSNPYGKPLIAKILNSYITLNLLDSMDATQPYLAQNRPRFFDLKSRINPRAFIDYGNVPGSTFPLFGDPQKAVHYQDIQFVPDTTNIKARLEYGIFNITGVDPAYKGRQTNSITTTGGIEAQQARVIMLTDNSPIVMLESFVEKFSKAYVQMAGEHIESVKVRRNNFVKEQVDLVFKEIKNKDFLFILESKPYLPMTKETLFEQLRKLYEMQGQYKFQIPLIQEEDLISELPVSAVRKSKLIQRVNSQKQADSALKRRETLMTFAALFQQFQQAGLADEEATDEALRTMDEEDMMQQQDPTLGTNPTTMPPQGGTPSAF